MADLSGSAVLGGVNPNIPMEFYQFTERLKRTPAEKNPEFAAVDGIRHLINAGQLTPDLVDRFCRNADLIRKLSADRETANRLRGLLSHRRAMLYFTQPSTRTFLSFMAACQILGLTCNEVRDPRTSSEVKRESQMDGIRMFSSYFDVIIMRTPSPQLAESCAYLMNDLASLGKRWVPIINAGSGSDEHPTQALLDVYTLKRTFQFTDKAGSLKRFDDLRQLNPRLEPGLERKTYTFCGDIGRGRTVRSLATLLSQYRNVRMIFVAPQQSSLQLDQRLRDALIKAGVDVLTADSLEAVVDGRPLLEQTDCLYMTRIQREHNSESDSQEIERTDLSPFQLTAERANRLPEWAAIMHPFPRDSVVKEIPETVDLNPRAMYFRQARNGMWARAALLTHIFGAESELQTLAR
jgi:aspartate carbamoyltransferase catalytic subunit